MAEETIFSKIIRREIPSDIVYQDELVTAFRDISPQAPTHILIIPNILIPTVNDVKTEHEVALGRMLTVAAKIAEQEGIAQDGYRLIMNCNRHGGQEVYHIHMHLLGGARWGRCWHIKVFDMLRGRFAALVMTLVMVGAARVPRSR
jgi:histidine triad (HIT) family protein